MSGDVMSPQAAIEHFREEFDAHLVLPSVMPLPEVAADGVQVELLTLGVFAAHQGKGFAGKALRLLIDACDACQVPLRVTVRPLPPVMGRMRDCPPSLNTRQLVEWLRRHDFVVEGAPDEQATRMVRLPL